MSSPTAKGAAAKPPPRDPAGPEGEPDIVRRQRGVALWRRRSRDVQIYRFALPALIVLIVLLLAGGVLYNTVAWRFAKPEAGGGVSIRMVNPKFYGRDSSNAPYVVTAASAVRDDRDLQKVTLTKPIFTLNAGGPTQSVLTAENGVFRDDTGILHLDKNLVVTDQRGYVFKSQRAVIDTKTGVIEGESAIDGVGPLGRLSASSYAVTAGGVQIFFRGNVHARIEAATRRASGPAAGRDGQEVIAR